jgi:hypothetical protein
VVNSSPVDFTFTLQYNVPGFNSPDINSTLSLVASIQKLLFIDLLKLFLVRYQIILFPSKLFKNWILERK